MNLWKKIPLARVALVFFIGLFLSTELNLTLDYLSLVLVLVILTTIFLLKLFWKSSLVLKIQGGLWLLLFLTLGIWRGELHKRNIHENWLTQQSIETSEGFLLKLTGEISEKKNSLKSTAKIIGFLRNDSLIEHDENTLCYFNKKLNGGELNKTDLILTNRKPNIIQHPKNPGEFNYKKYLAGLGIQTQFYVDSNSLKIQTLKKDSSLLDILLSLKTASLNSLRKMGIQDNAFSIIAALVFGKKDYLDQETYRSYGAAGATHVLAVSGLHVGLIYIILIKLCIPLKNLKRGNYITLIIGLIGLWLYAAITGFSPSVLRASTMFSAILIGRQLNKNTNIYNTLAASALVLLFISPNLLMEVGFQLSYSAVLGIILVQPWLYQMWTPRFWLIDKVWQLSTVSVAAQLGTFPIGMLYFHQFPNYFLVSNLVVIPAATLILYLTLISLTFSFSEVISNFLGSILQKIVEYLNYFISKIEELPYAVTEGIDISILECFLLYTIIILTLRVLINNTFSSLKYAIMFAIGYLAFQCHETYLQSNQCFLLIHSIKNERVLSIVEGNTSYLIASEKFLNDADKIKFHVSHFWDKSGIKQKQTAGIYDENSESDIFILVNGKLFFKNLQIEIENESNSNYSFTHTFLNTYDESCSVNSILIEDEMSFVPKGIEPEQTVLKATENALILH